MSKKQCEVKLQFKVPKDKLDEFMNARNLLFDVIGLECDTGGCFNEEINCYLLDWEFDWSLNDKVNVFFYKFKD